jgi:hypothetical protein
MTIPAIDLAPLKRGDDGRGRLESRCLHRVVGTVSWIEESADVEEILGRYPGIAVAGLAQLVLEAGRVLG